MKFFEKPIKNKDRLVVFRCQSCNKPIHPERGFKRIGENFYCGMECLKEKLEQEERFRKASDPFNDEPLNFKKKKWYQI